MVCKKSGIPSESMVLFEGYQHDNSKNEEIEQELNELAIAEDFQLFEFFSRQNAKSLEESMKLVYLQAFAMGMDIGFHICYKYSLLIFSKQSISLVELLLT